MEGFCMSLSFEQTIRLAGLMPRVVVPDGKIRRCKSEMNPNKNNGWYVLHADGRGAWGDWTSGSGQSLGTWHEEGATQHAVSAEVIAKMKAQREAERNYRIQAVKSARAFWSRAKPLSLPHPYIANKGLSPLGCSGLRTHDGLLVIPVMLGDSLISVQTITIDGVKKFWPGAPVKAGACVLHRPRAVVTALVEGFATGLAVYQSMRNASVIVCFDAGNLIRVAARIKPHGSVVVVADNDHKTMVKRGVNPGIEAAKNTAELIGCGIYYPEGIEGSDAADYLKEIGEGAAKKLERLILAKAKYVMT
jgi:putative DNA primase/helicase